MSVIAANSTCAATHAAAPAALELRATDARSPAGAANAEKAAIAAKVAAVSAKASKDHTDDSPRPLAPRRSRLRAPRGWRAPATVAA